jgi:TolA-binding protein
MEAYRTGRYGDAADELSAYVRSPSAQGGLLPSGIHHLARSYARMGNPAASARHYEDLLRRFPSYGNRSQVLMEAAQVQTRLGNYTRAEALLTELERRPGWASRARRERLALERRRAATRAVPSAVDAAEDIRGPSEEAAAEPAEAR